MSGQIKNDLLRKLKQTKLKLLSIKQDHKTTDLIDAIEFIIKLIYQFNKPYSITKTLLYTNTLDKIEQAEEYVKSIQRRKPKSH